MRTSGELAAALLADRCRFQSAWLEQDLKITVPLPSPGRIDQTMARRLSIGARATCVSHVMGGKLGAEHADEPVAWIALTAQGLLDDFSWRDVDFLLCLPDRSGALLVTTNGYALLVGTLGFVRACVPEGVGEARSRFARYAKKMARRWPRLPEVANEFGSLMYSWCSPAEVDPGTGVAEQVALMRSLACGEISAATFASSWLGARRRALDEGERTRERFDRILTEVFYALDDYVVDPNLRDPSDLSEDQLLSRVRAALVELRKLDDK